MIANLAQTITTLLPFVVAIFVYFIRIETRLAKICQDLEWLKRELLICRQPSEKHSQ